MSYLETLRHRRKTPQAAWHKLRTSIDVGKFDFFAAFEGEEDEEFYSVFFEKELSGVTFRPIVCDGKGGVLGLYERTIEAFGSTRNIFFFIDSDHDRYIGIEKYPENVFATAGYSIESYAFDFKGIIRLVRKHFQLNESDPVLQEIGGRIEIDMLNFAKGARRVMAYAICLRSKDEDIEMDKLHFVDFFEFRDGRLVNKKVDCRVCLDSLNCNLKLSYSEVSRCIRSIRRDATELVVRGKLILQFIVSLFKQISRDYDKAIKLNGKPLRMKMELNSRNFMLQFAEVVDPPESVLNSLSVIRAAVRR